MAKRLASNDLNHDNWNVEEESEEAGRFTPVDKSELKNRVIRKAKRTMVEKSDTPGTSPFAAFSGFSSKGFSFTSNLKSSTSQESGTSEPVKTFSFFSKPNTSSPSSSVQPPTARNFTFTPKVVLTTSVKASLTKTESKAEDSTQNGSSNSKLRQTEESPSTSVSNSNSKVVLARSIEYYRQLQSLNESVIKWMQLHLSKNPCCDFNPVFMDYKKHLDTLNVTYPVKRKEIPTSPTPSTQNKADDFNFKRPSPTSYAGSFGKQVKKSNDNENFSASTNNNENLSKMFSPKRTNSPKEDDDKSDYGAHFASNTTNTSTFSFGMKLTPTGTSTATPDGPTTTSSENDNPEKSPTSFGFKSTLENKMKTEDTKDKPFSFAFTPVPRPAENETSEDSEYMPPKNDVVAVQEEGAIYSKKCKLFFKKGDNFADKGVGNLHLKPLGEKTQLVVRADTSLGNILLNIMLSPTLPISRTGKNNVLIVCVPNPPIDLKNPDSKEAIPMLIRVKTEKDADELFETLKLQMKSEL